MPATRIGFALALWACLGLAQGQPAAPHLSFEVASVKASAPAAAGVSARGVVHGGPGSTDPGFARFENIDLFSLATMACGIQRYQLSAPEWLNTARFDITAKLPPGATVEQYRVMLQDLLAERFKLVLHREQKEKATYDLVVGKNGPKLKQSADDPAAANDGLQPPPFQVRPPMGFAAGLSLGARKWSMEQLAATLSGLLDQTVTDATGLTGKYDFTLRCTLAGIRAGAPSEPDDAAASTDPTIFDAVQEQLGLKLVSKKGPVDILVIDRIERVPTEN
jgi:uncharacterized protein (TIGR03435 family)